FFSLCSSSVLTCCPGWRQQGSECLIAVCEGNFTCKENEVCVRPGECRCRHGYFGANCDTKCPRQFWGPDCKEMCSCHPNGQCEDVTGQCTCNPNRWGPKCENVCLCKHGKCDQKTGKCTCEPNWWGPQCSSSCYCSHNSQCDQQTGNCLCQPGWWGRGCNNQCSCNNSPCEQFTGRCQCRERTFGPRCDRYCQCYKGKCNQVDGTCTCEPGYRGKYCREPCPAGFYGQGCRRRCGQCKSLQPCTVADGRCLTCEPGWNGTKCDQPCSPGFYGEGCEQLCPPCKDGHTCNHINGRCSHCNPGWIGDRCTGHRQSRHGSRLCVTPLCRGRPALHRTVPLCTATPTAPHGKAQPTLGDADRGDQGCARGSQEGSGATLCVPSVAPHHFIPVLRAMGCCASRAVAGTPMHPHAVGPGAFGVQWQERTCGKLPCFSQPHQPMVYRPRGTNPRGPGSTRLCVCCTSSFYPSATSRVSPSPRDTAWLRVPAAQSVGDSRDRGTPASPGDKLVAPTSGEEAGEYTFLKETGSVRAFPADSSETPLLKSSDSERSSCGSGSAGAVLYARVARLSKQSKEEEDATAEPRSPGKPPSPERTKPRPPDPATKPKVSWIHSRYNSSQSNSLPAPSRSPEPAAARSSSPEHGQGLAKRKRSPSETSAGVQGRVEEKGSTRGKEKAPKQPKEPGVPEGKAGLTGEPQSPSKPKQRNKTGSEPTENINGAVQNTFRKMGAFQPERRVGDNKDAPRSPGTSKPRSEPLHPQLSSELAAQLKEKTQSLNKGDGGTRANGVGAQREKPTPPQKAKRSAAAGGQKTSKPLLPTSPHLQKLIPGVAEPAAGEAKRVEKPSTSSSHDQALPSEQVAKKTPIKKPPRKKSREASLEPPRAAAVPAQAVQ
ncbi:SREC2 protein, partial [Columbina picui]|nr:SREC2 protein [Columbina picui]